MKKQWMFSLAALLLTATVFGQVENDDMYFNSKDRAKLRAQTASEAPSYTASAKKPKKVEQAAAEEVVNPTDSYSARNVNPEFAARSNSQSAAADNQDYFVNNYRNATSSQLNSWNNNFSGWYNNNWYGSMSYNPGGPYGYGSPYYGSYYDTWGTPWYNRPYYGWTTGIGLSYSYGSPYYMNSWYGYPYAAYGYGYSGYGYGNYGYGYGSYGYGYGGGYPGTVVIVNNGGDNGRNVAYGKRASRGGIVTTPQEASYTRTRTNYPTAVRPDDAGGRASTSGRTTQRQEEYYNRSWRGSQQTNSYQQSQNRSSSFDPWSGNSNRDSYNRDSNSSFSPSRSSSSFDGGGTRQSAPASSGSNGRSRGRD